MTERNLFQELVEGFHALADERNGQVPLRKVSVESPESAEKHPETLGMLGTL